MSPDSKRRGQNARMERRRDAHILVYIIYTRAHAHVHEHTGTRTLAEGYIHNVHVVDKRKAKSVWYMKEGKKIEIKQAGRGWKVGGGRG